MRLFQAWGFKVKNQETFSVFAVVLSFLSRIFLQPADKTIMENLKKEDLLSHWPLPGDSITREEINRLKSFIQHWTPACLAKMTFDYTRLFTGLEKTLAPPYASIYLGRERIVFDAETLEVRGWYRRYGLKSRHRHNEPDDHIGLELSFLAHLCRLGAEADEFSRRESLLKDMHRFLSQHVMTWVPDFFALVKKHAETPFYTGWAYLTEETVKSLTDFVSFLQTHQA